MKKDLLVQDKIRHIINLQETQPGGVERNTEVSMVLNNAIQILMVIGVLAVLFMFFWGAFEWIVSGGDKEKVGNARKKITAALVGLALIALAFLIVFIFGSIFNIDFTKVFTIPSLGG